MAIATEIPLETDFELLQLGEILAARSGQRDCRIVDGRFRQIELEVVEVLRMIGQAFQRILLPEDEAEIAAESAAHGYQVGRLKGFTVGETDHQFSRTPKPGNVECQCVDSLRR